MRILVTGHQGYLGSLVVPVLLAAGHEVVGLDTGLFERCRFDGQVSTVPSVRVDVRDVQPTHVRGFEAIVHLAGLSNDPLGDLDPAVTRAINYEGTVRLAEMAKQEGVTRFVFSSTCSVYGAAGDGWLDENSPCLPVTPYAESKMRAEVALQGLADSGFSPVILRSATAYGASPFLRFDLVLNNLVAWAVTRGQVLLKSDGTAWRPIVHARDIAAAFAAVLAAPVASVHGQVLNVGQTQENYRVVELAQMVADTVAQSQVVFSPGVTKDARCYRVDCSKIARTLTGWKPQWSARRGAEELYQAYIRAGLQAEDFEGPRFKRIDSLRGLLQSGELEPDLRWRLQPGR